jgi:hypothetical protein
MHHAASLLPPKFVVIMLLILVSLTSFPCMAVAATMMTTTVRNDPRALQPDNGSGNNPEEVGTGNNYMPRETEDAPPP